MTRRILAIGLTWLSLLTPAHAQRVIPGDQPVVVPPVSRRQIRDAERDADRAAERRSEDKFLEPRRPSLWTIRPRATT
jgi:hypothetical protein